MSNCTRQSGRNDYPLEVVEGAGPSAGMRAWVAFLEERIDWLIDARRRWREGDRPMANGALLRWLGWRSVVVALVVQLVLVLQHLLGT